MLRSAMRIANALFEDAEEPDRAGPWEVLWARAPSLPDDGVEVLTSARGPVRRDPQPPV